MAKRRKMLGSIDDPVVVSLQRMIETQSKTTLTAWAVDCAEARYLPIYEKDYPQDSRLRETVETVRACLRGEKKLAEVKPLLRQARQTAQEAEADSAAQAAARAVSTACAVIQTPTNALGFTFYGAAAVAYDRLGLDAAAEAYDAAAAEEFAWLASSLREALVPDEPNPAKISWGC